MKTLLSIIILIATGCNSQSPKSRIEKNAVPTIDSFFKTISENQPAVALDHLLSTNINIDIKDSSTLKLKNNFNLINLTSGSYMGNSILKKRFIHDDIGIYSYLVKYEKKFYRFVFMFYNNGSSIKLYKFLFDDNIDVELEESLKYYLN